MKNILEELYFGNIGCNVTAPQTEEGAQRLDELCKLEDDLLATLEGGQKERFIDYANLCNTCEAEEKPQDFINGFRLGAQMMLAVTTGKDAFLW